MNMISKIKKILLMFFIIFFILIISDSVYARQIDNLEDLTKEIEYINPDAESAYVIGDYVFTSAHRLKIKDVMLASTSVKVSEGDKTKPEEMTIYQLSKDFIKNEWKVEENFFGNKQWNVSESSPMNLQYIDYTAVKEIYTVTFDTDGGDKIDSVTVYDGEIVSRPQTDPTREGYVFKGWYKDGDSTEYDFGTPVTENITLKAKWSEITEFSIQAVASGSDAATKLANVYQWNIPKEYSASFNKNGKNISVTGLIPKVDSLKEGVFDDAHLTKYYLAFVINTTDTVTDRTIVKISGNGEEKTLTGKDFDDATNMYMLRHLHIDDATKTFTIEIDIDGEEDLYEANTYTVNWNDLILQKESASEVNLDLSVDDKTALKELGYTIPETDGYKLENGLLTGTIQKQMVKEDAFGADKKTGYFFAFNIKPTTETINEKIKVTVTGKNESVFDYDKFQDGSEWILFRIDDEYVTKECCKDNSCNSACCKESSDSSAACTCGKTVTIVVDLDGDGKEYLPETYTIDYCGVTFKSDVEIVNSQAELVEALGKQEKKIYIGQSFDITSNIEINYDVTILGGDYTLTAKDNVNSIFTVKSGNVTINNIKLVGATKAGIEVENGATLTVNELTFDEETYEKPAVIAGKTNATVKLTNSDSSIAEKIEKEKITRGELDDTKAKDNEYTYYNYYNNPAVSKIYTTVFYTHEAGYRLSYTKYNYYNEKINPPESDRFKTYNYDGETYSIIGYSENANNTVIRDTETIPQDVIPVADLRATADRHYWASFKVTLKDGIKKVSTPEAFVEAIKDDNVSEIYIQNDITIDLTTNEELNKELKINRNLSIIGKSGSQPTIKANKIVITENAKDVFLNRLNIEISAQEDQDALIEVLGEKCTLWQSGVENKGTAVDYAIKYANQKSVVDIRWMGVGSKGFNPANINKAYIYVDGKMAEGSDIYLNTFKELTSNDKASAVIINGFDESAAITEEDNGEPDIRFASNTCKNTYAIKLTKEASDQEADIEFSIGTQANIGVEYDDDHKNFENIKLHGNSENVIPKYIKNEEVKEATEFASEGGKGITFVSNVSKV